jgi:nicotinamide-nucleotide amidase
MPSADARARISTAELLSIGTELTVGETRDTNAGEIARWLADEGVRVLRMTALPDDLPTVRDAFAAGLARADLVVSTGGLGPTPDDLTREAVAALCGETPHVDPGLERWLRELWARRGMSFPELNLKQAWLIPSAEAIPNGHGTAPGWFVQPPTGGVIVTLPGPPREMRAMWAEQVLPRLRERGFGREQVVRTYRLAGIGESQVADILGEGLLRSSNPVVATYARSDAVDVRISAVPEDPDGERPGRSAEELADEAEAVVLSGVGRYVWGRGAETWPEAVGRRLAHLGWTLATVEIGTGGTLAGLLGAAPWLRLAESMAADAPEAVPAASNGAEAEADRRRIDGPEADHLAELTERTRDRARADVALGVRVGARGADTGVDIVVVTPGATHRDERLAFLGGAQGRSRAALLASACLLDRLRDEAADEDLAGDPAATRTPPPHR